MEIERAMLEALLERYREMVVREWKVPPDPGHDPEYWAIKERVEVEEGRCT